MDNKEYNLEINKIINEYNVAKASGVDKVIGSLDEVRASVTKLGSLINSKVSNYKVYLDAMATLGYSDDYYQPSEYFKGVRTLKQSVNTQDLQNLGNNMNSAASEIKRVSPEIDAEIEVTLERIKAIYNVLKAYIAQYEEIDDKLRNLFKQMNSIYDSGHLSDIM